MKKIISALLILSMVVSIFAVSASADGSMYINCNMKDEAAFNSMFNPGLFYIEEEILYGYMDARALQTRYDDENPADNPYGWVTYDTSCEVAFSEDDLADGNRYFSVVYCNINQIAMGMTDVTYYMNFNYDITNQQLYLTGGAVGFNEDDILMGPVPYEMESDGSEYYTFGMSVSDGRIRCYIGDELIFDFVDTANEYLIGNTIEAPQPTPLVWWNDNNFLQFRDIKVSSPGYLYPIEMEQNTDTTASLPINSDDAGNAGDNNNNNNAGNADATTTTTTKETTTRIESEVVTNDKGETEVVTKVVTEATTTPAAQTNTNRPTGGNATATGDSTFVVVAAMVATLGCAIIVKKASVR